MYKRFFEKYKIRQQLKIIFIFTIALPIILIGCIICPYSLLQINQSYQNLTTSDAMRVRSIMLDVTMDFYRISEQLANNTQFQTLMTADYTNEEDAKQACDAFSFFQTTLEDNPSVSSMKFYYDSSLLSSINYQDTICPFDSSIESTPWFQYAKDNVSGFWRSTSYTDSHENTYWELTYYRHITFPKSGTYGILVMSISDNYIRNLIDNDSNQIYLSINDMPVFFSSTRSLAGTAFPVPIDYSENYFSQAGYMRIQNQISLNSVITLVPYQSDDRIYIMSSDTHAINQLKRIFFAFILILVLTILIPLIIFIFFTKYFSARVQTLRMAMHQVSNSNYELNDFIQGDDELSAIFSDLKIMATNIKKTESQIYEVQIHHQDLINHQQQMELKMLSSQINPHFLYNTLETIRMKAFSEGNKEVATAIKMLGKFMRYVLNNTGTTSSTLANALDFTKTYLAIQKLRFTDRLDYRISIPESFQPAQYKILPLLIQPIVENSISHGIADSGDPGTVILHIRPNENDDTLIIKIFDNGCGMDPETLEQVQMHIKVRDTATTQRIGMQNINSRIKLFYGSKYGILLKSKKNCGTMVTITIPLCTQ